MATTIGRVEFIVGLDGKKLAGEAERLGNEMARSGDDAGDKFGKGFESSFERRLSGIGKNFTNEMRKTGDLAGESLGTSMERKVKSSFQRMQDNLANVLTDDDAFKKYALGFDSVDDAVKQLEADLGELHKANRVYRDDQGQMRSDTILYKQDLDGLTESIRERGKVTQESIDRDKQWALAMEQLDADIARTLRTIGNTDDFEKASKAVGGTANEYRRLRAELDNLRDANKLSIVQYEKAVDALDRTREKVDANAKTLRDNAKAADDAARAAERLDKATAEVGRTMGDSRTFRERAAALGSVAAATDEAQAAIDKLKNLGASETRIEGLSRKLKGLHDEFDAGKDRPNVWMRIMDKAAQKVSSSWQRMDGTVKLVLGLILSAGPEVAALGSAVGSGLMAVGGAATSMVIGVVGAVAVLKNLNQELETAPAAMKPVIREFGRFKDSIGDASDAIAQAAFDEMGGAFDTLRTTVGKLEPALGKVGTALGKMVKGFAEGTKEGTDAFKEIQKAIENTGPNLEKLGGIAGTFGTALLRAFNEAQPMVEQMFGWLGKLADRFDTFTKDAEAMDEWIGNGMRIWQAFGGVLDAVGDTLSNLVTPDAVDNTVALLDNLARLAPALGDVLAIFGAFDAIGLLVGIFADIGEVMAPLAPMMIVIAQALNNIIEAVPAPVWLGVAAAIMTLAGSLVYLKVADLVTKAMTPLAPLLTKIGGAAKNASGGLTGLGKAGVIGAVAAGAVTAAFALDNLYDSVTNLDARARKLVGTNATLEDSYTELSASVFGVKTPLTDVSGALDHLTGSGAKGMLGSLGNAFTGVGNQANALSQTLGDLSPALAKLSPEDAAKKFQEYTKELGANRRQAANMIETMPEFKASLEDAAAGADGLATDAEILDYALGKLPPAAKGSADALAGMSGAMEEGASGAELQSAALERLTGKTLEALDAVDGVTDGIKSMGSAFRSEQGAAISYQESIKTVTDSIAENGKVWDITTEAGRANQQAVMDLAQSTLDLAAEQYNLTGSATDAAASIQAGRDAVIAAVDGMDLGGLTAEEYADKLGLIPSDVETVISANTAAGMEMADAFATRLYELGLIEVDPVIALNTAAAEEAAAAVQAQLDTLTFNPFTAVLDANGDPVSGVAAEAEGKLYDFSTGEYVAKLSADQTGVNAAMTEATTLLAGYDTSTHTTKLDADASKAGAAIDKTTTKAGEFGAKTFTGTLDIDNIPGMSKVETTTKKLDAVDKSVTTPKVDANTTKATEKTKLVSDDLLKLDKFTAFPKIDVNNKDAIAGTDAVKVKMDGLKNKTVYIDVVTRNSTVTKQAAGGIAVTPTLSIWGEAGPEALVPLNRPLSMVDPAVRTLSAIAQGKMSITAAAEPNGLAGGAGRPSRTVNIEAGAIVVQGNMAPEATATMTVNRIAERLA